MIWIGISLIICAILVCCTIILVNFEKEQFNKAINCLRNLCDVINEKFPGSDLKVTYDERGVKVEGDLKYIIKHDN